MPRTKKPSEKKRAVLEQLEAAMGHAFQDRTLLERALVHRSYAHEKGRPGDDSESLEFLGDAVLSLSVSWLLFSRFDGAEVGDLARARAYLVSETNLAKKARLLGLGDHLRLGRGEERGGGREKDSLLADAYEAVLAAVYIDGGLEASLAAVTRQFTAQVSRLKPGARSEQDFKTDVQEALQAAGLPVPRYKVVAEQGPDHRKLFSVQLMVSDTLVARGRGHTKKAAGQQAARRALRGIQKVITEIKEKARKQKAGS